MMRIRAACPDDADQIGQLIFDTVRSININDYSQEQVEAWAPDSQIFRTYPESFAYVAEIDGKIVGFANITPEGYLNRLYTHKDHQGQALEAARHQNRSQYHRKAVFSFQRMDC